MSAVVVALLGFGVALLAARSPMGRMTNLALPGDFPEVYVQYKIGDPERCLVTDRGGSTASRSEADLGAARWNCRRSGPSGEALLALDGQRASFLFVPYESVVDPVYPLLYDVWSHTPGEPPLPRLRWVHLFVDRTYRGFYLQATLATRDFFEEKALGELEMLATTGGALYCFDRKLREICPLYSGQIAESHFPHPYFPPAAGRLAALLPSELPRVFLLAEKPLEGAAKEADPLRPWPLPFDFPRLVTSGGKPYFDQRFASWQPPPAEELAPLQKLAPLAAAHLEPPQVAARLRAALKASCGVRGCDAEALAARIESSATWAALAARTGGEAP